MKNWLSGALTLGILGFSLGLSANVAAQQASEAPDLAEVSQSLAPLGLQVNAVANSPMPGLLQVFTQRGLFFTSSDGRFFIEGNIFDLQKAELVNDVQMRSYVSEQLPALADSYIEYKAKDEKHVVYAFTDPTCGYCQKLHSEMKQYNDAGITIRYLAFPRGGLNSKTALDMQHLWCSRNQQKAMDLAKDNKRNPPAMCDNPVKKHYELGQSFGINGTPALILDTGRIIPGYQPVAGLLKQFEAN
ncbi:bifunctional protein-disulfide isomerase/oxidoreductase DsbC [Arsukibacterium indicum]|uniref:Thiol:disulfide interchange protein n=1 Tax=Arsukibacterium indicum TaxID=2848612 RepID=A0ABS6MKQ8_9GAMM|nr:bifunctional protein-disulfide isomerase/oxidoreductase DsbC [Arsukibacterium indicum]MBV2129398.1 bifunctional protein-disulfide isomerase/oxidoreductase DsbC [Arsukibacterium indicum]